MLTADLALSWQRGTRTGPRYIATNDSTYLRVATDLISIVSGHVGRRRAELDCALQEYVGVGTDYKILRGLIKLITDRCRFDTATIKDPAEARRALFFKARLRHPVSESDAVRREVIGETAAELGCSPDELIESLYGDLTENQRLTAFEQMSADELLDLYNLSQAQALLYRCLAIELRVEPQEVAGYRQLFGAIKAYRLMHTISGNPGTGYVVRLDGPVSIFHRSQKYGVQMAVFLPALLRCRAWRLRAEIDLKQGRSAFFDLSSTESRLRPDTSATDTATADTSALGYSAVSFDESRTAEKLALNWAKHATGWVLEPSKEVIDLGDSAFIPDFVIRPPRGESVYLELLGFWTPRYLDQRLKEFERGGFTRFILAVSEELRGSREAPSKLPPNVVAYKTSLGAEAVKEVAMRLVDIDRSA